MGDLGFEANWDFQAYAGDVDAMINLIKTKAGTKTIFLAGHSQGGGFVANYAARLQPDGKRGVDKLSGLIFLDGGPNAGEGEPNEDQLKTYFDHVADLRSGKSKVYTDAHGLLGPIAGPESGMSQSVTGVYYAFEDPQKEALFPLRVAGAPAQPGDELPEGPADELADPLGRQLRHRARAGRGRPGGRHPLPGRRSRPPRFHAAAGHGRQVRQDPGAGDDGSGADRHAQGRLHAHRRWFDPDKVYGWIEGGGNGGSPIDAGKAMAWLKAQGWAPARSNIKPVTVTFKGERRGPSTPRPWSAPTGTPRSAGTTTPTSSASTR